MLIHVDITEKTIGPKILFEEMNFEIEEGQKVAMIGRNGVGKTTLFKMISGDDMDFEGEIDMKKGISIIHTAQEHFFVEDITPLAYVLKHVPRYSELKRIIDTYPDIMGTDMKRINTYTDAIHTFSERGYYDIEDKIIQDFAHFDINFEQALSSMKKLSGGEKRFVELIKVMYAAADLALVDEPTNHMDYIGKQLFEKWLEEVKHAVIVITHDRDVLEHVEKIIEIKDRKAFLFHGNYDKYLQQNSLSTVTQVKGYELSLKSLDKLHKQIMAARTKKLSAKSNKGRVAAKILEDRLQRQYDEVKNNLEKPSFWIDKESIETIDVYVAQSYHKYKDKNITLRTSKEEYHKKELLQVKDLSLGYAHPLFTELSFRMEHGDRMFIKGRNGAGKSTLLKAIIAKIKEVPLPSTLFSGVIKLNPKILLGVYEQEVSEELLSLTLYEAIVKIYYTDNKIAISEQKIFQLMGDYLFHPYQDKDLRISQLSGGQKARFQLISMLCNNPNLLILDEPTNHLDLPSIEEMENALLRYTGAILYVSHDSYFIKTLGGLQVSIP